MAFERNLLNTRTTALLSKSYRLKRYKNVCFSNYWYYASTWVIIFNMKYLFPSQTPIYVRTQYNERITIILKRDYTRYLRNYYNNDNDFHRQN